MAVTARLRGSTAIRHMCLIGPQVGAPFMSTKPPARCNRVKRALTVQGVNCTAHELEWSAVHDPDADKYPERQERHAGAYARGARGMAPAGAAPETNDQRPSVPEGGQ